MMKLNIMMKILFITLILLIISLASCKGPKEALKAPDYAKDTLVTKNMIDGSVFRLPSDTSKMIIVYNIIEQEDKKKRISDETIRASVGQFFSTISTIFALYLNDNKQ